MQSVVFGVNNSGTIINNHLHVGNMRICQACGEKKWPVDENGMQQACLTEDCIKSVLVIIEDLPAKARNTILLGYAFAIERRFSKEDE